MHLILSMESLEVVAHTISRSTDLLTVLVYGRDVHLSCQLIFHQVLFISEYTVFLYHISINLYSLSLGLWVSDKSIEILGRKPQNIHLCFKFACSSAFSGCGNIRFTCFMYLLTFLKWIHFQSDYQLFFIEKFSVFL